MNPNVVQACREMLQVFQPHLSRVLTLPFQIVEQFPQVTLVCIERIARHVPLQFQIPHVSPYHLLLNLFHLYIQVVRSPRAFLLVNSFIAR
jgi:hypothetical protein